MLQLRFGEPGMVHDAKSFTANSDVGMLSSFLASLQSKGVRLTSRGLLFLSAAHSSADVELTTEAVRHALRAIQAPPDQPT